MIFLAVQWLGLHASTAGHMCLSLVTRTNIPHAAWCGQEIFFCPCPYLGSDKAMAAHSSTLARKILGREEPGRLQSMGSPSPAPLSDFTFTFHIHALEKEMAAHSSVLAWRIPGTGEPGGLPSVGSHRVRHD